MDIKESWTILGIDPTSDVRAVKAAYAKLVRTIDPESDPVSFSRLHTAYKDVIDSLRQQANGSNLRDSSRIAGSYIPDIPKAERAEPLHKMSTLAFSYEESLLEDILQYKEDNQLSSELTLNMLEPHNRIRLIQGLKKRYKTIIDATDDLSLWKSFLDEPLVKPLLNYSDVRTKIMENIGSSTKCYSELKKLLADYNGIEKYLEKKAAPKPEPATIASNPTNFKLFLLLGIIGTVLYFLILFLIFG